MSRRPPEIAGMYSLKVDNLTYRTTVDDMQHTFGKFGEIGDIYIPRDAYTNESRGFAFVRFVCNICVCALAKNLLIE